MEKAAQRLESPLGKRLDFVRLLGELKVIENDSRQSLSSRKDWRPGRLQVEWSPLLWWEMREQLSRCRVEMSEWKCGWFEEDETKGLSFIPGRASGRSFSSLDQVGLSRD